MKTFKKFILEQLHQQILLEMPYASVGEKTFDLELELRVPVIYTILDSTPDEKQALYNTLVAYISQWYRGYSFLYKVKEPWTGMNGTGGLKSKLKSKSEKLFSSDDKRIHYKFDNDKVYKLIPSGDPKNPTEKEETPQKIESKNSKAFLENVANALKLQLTALGKTKEQFITDVPSSKPLDD